MERTLTLKAVSELLAPERGQSVGAFKVQLSRWAKEPGFPVDRPNGGDPLFNADEVRAWILANPKTRKDTPAAITPASTDPKDTPAPQELLDAMEAATSPVERARVAERMAAHRVMMGAKNGNLTAREMENLSKRQEELRKAEKANMELQREMGELIERDKAKANIGQIIQRLLADYESLKNSIAMQVEIWLEDSDFKAGSVDDRGRITREWVDTQATQMRTTTADEMDEKFGARFSPPPPPQLVNHGD